LLPWLRLSRGICFPGKALTGEVSFEFWDRVFQSFLKDPSQTKFKTVHPPNFTLWTRIAAGLKVLGRIQQKIPATTFSILPCYKKNSRQKEIVCASLLSGEERG